MRAAMLKALRALRFQISMGLSKIYRCLSGNFPLDRTTFFPSKIIRIEF